MGLILAFINGAIVIGTALVRIRQKPFLALDLSWAVLSGFFMNYCLRPILIELSPDTFAVYATYGNGADDKASERALVLALLFITTFAAVDLLCGAMRGKQVRPKTYRFMTLVGSTSFTTASWVMVSLGPIGIAGYLRATEWEGTTWELLSGAARFHILGRHAGLGYYMLAMYMGLIGWLALCIQWEIARTATPKSVPNRLVRITPMLVCLLVFIIFGERQGIIITILTPMFVSLVRLGPIVRSWSKVRQMRRMVFYCVCAVAIGGPFGMVLKQHDNWGPLDSVALAMSPWDSYELTLLAVDRFAPEDALYGRSYMEDVVYTYMPRVFFPEKPFRYGIYSIQDRVCPELEQLSGSFPPGILVEAYVNAGYAYLIVPIVLAWLSARVYAKVYEGNLYWIAQTGLIFPILWLFRSLGSVLSQFVLNSLLLLALAGLTRVFDLRDRKRAMAALRRLLHPGAEFAH